ncbi:hypothetical protein GGI15_002918 [Coemansia interrupta]|uniref:CFA20 domain-containing protein n=1 Tax=Coemansia interrupta TaxID=1126814 RepID=A0A9W8HDE1_9FUNG|nr:hypothetical protein GGI15_002918 [Coemansia interrupta]
MLRGVYHSGMITVFNSTGTNPLQLWSTAAPATDAENSSICFGKDEAGDNNDKIHIEGAVLTIKSQNLRDTFISCPRSLDGTLGIKLPFMTIQLKNLGHLFSFEIETLDDHKLIRRFRASNYQAQAQLDHDIATLPLRLEQGWNHLTFDLEDMTKRLYGRKHCETRRITIHASIGLRLVMFSDRIVAEEQLPGELRLYGILDD